MIADLTNFSLNLKTGSSKGHIFEINNEEKLCGNSSGSQACPDSYTCMQGSAPNPDFGYTNFDNIFGSFLSAFRLVTRDFWEHPLQMVLATAGPWHIITFIVIIFIVSYQVLSLVWGQIAVSYNYIRLERWEQKLIAEDADVEEPVAQDTNQDKCKLIKFTHCLVTRTESNSVCNMVLTAAPGVWSKIQRFFFFIIYNPYVVLFVIICIILNTLCMALDHHDMTRDLEMFLRTANYVSRTVWNASNEFLSCHL